MISSRASYALASTLLGSFVLAVAAHSLSAQSIDDGLMLPKRGAMVGVLYAHDSWNQYWEGTLKRSNGNIGTLTTESATLVAGYGVTSRLSFIATLPYVRTQASQGTLEGMRGIQDLTLAAKYRLFASDLAGQRGFSASVVAAGALPASKYTPDFMPLSIGTGGSRASARLILGYRSTGPWFATASGAYTFCNNVRLDRNSYFTDGQLYLTNEVAMPNVTDYTFRTGYQRGRWQVPVTLVQRFTLGGGDIRRQDMPFVSDRMNFTALGAETLYALDRSGHLSLRAGIARILTGRNVGQSTTLTSGMTYAFHL